MKKLIRGCFCESVSPSYSLLRSESLTRSKLRHKSTSVAVPVGHLPLYVGNEMERFVVSAALLNHPIFMKLLNQSAQVYGYEQKGVLRIPCHVIIFRRVLEALRNGDEPMFDDLVEAL